MKPITLVLLFATGTTVVLGSTSFRMEPSQFQSADRGTLVREQIPIVRFSQDIRTGHDAVNFETGNGITVQDQTQIVQGRGGVYEDGRGKLIKTDQSVVKTGTYTYTSPEGLPISVTWVADENGYRAEGAHFPTTPAPLSPVRDGADVIPRF